MFRFLIQRPVAVTVSFFALILLGITTSGLLPTSLLPAVDIPQITIRIPATGHSSNEIERLITMPMRIQLQQIEGLEDIESEAGDGNATIRLSFNPGLNMSLAFIAVNEKVDLIIGQLPKDVERPLVVRQSVSNIPVFHISIYDRDGDHSPKRLADISTLTNEIFRQRLEQLPQIAMVDITGYTKSQIQISPKDDYLRTMGIDNQMLQKVFQDNRIALSSIRVKDGDATYFLKFDATLNDVSSIANLPVPIGKRIFLLKDLAQIAYLNAPSEGEYYFNNSRAIDLSVIKKANVRMSDLQKASYDLVNRFKREHKNLIFRITQDQTAFLDYSISNLEQDLVIGGILAILLMLLFVRKIGPSLLIAITIPVSLIISQIGFYFFNISLNIFSLGGLILGLSMVIDNSIVVIDTINLNNTKESNITDAAVKSANEIIAPLIASMFTNFAVFIPLMTMSGIAGAIFHDQALSVTIGVAASMIVALFLLPSLYIIIQNSRKHFIFSLELPSYFNITTWYKKGHDLVFKHKMASFLFVFLFLISGIILLTRLSWDKLPPIPYLDTQVDIHWNSSTTLNDSYQRIKKLMDENNKSVSDYSLWLGKQQYVLSNLSELNINDAKLYLRSKDTKSLKVVEANIVNVFKRQYPLATFEIRDADNAFNAVFSDDERPLRVLLSNEDGSQMPEKALVMDVTNRLKFALPNTVINSIPLQSKLMLTVSAEKTARYKLSLADIRNAVIKANQPLVVGDFQGGNKSFPIIVSPSYYVDFYEMLRVATVENPDGHKYPLAEFISVSKKEDYSRIMAGKQGQYYAIDIKTHNPEPTLIKAKQTLHPYNRKVNINFDGGYFSNMVLIRQLSIILLVSIGLLYFILAAQFESLLQPLFILAELPVSMMGAIYALYFGGNSINLISMIGLVVLGGLVINDSILKIDAINRLRRSGMPLKQAIYEGGVRRLKPIVMICFTSIGSLLPTLFMSDLGSELQRPLSLVLCGGMAVGLIVSLYFVPLIYWLVYRRKDEVEI